MNLLSRNVLFLVSQGKFKCYIFDMTNPDDSLSLAFRRLFAAEAACKRAEDRAFDARAKTDSRTAINRSRALLDRVRPPYLIPISEDPPTSTAAHP